MIRPENLRQTDDNMYSEALTHQCQERHQHVTNDTALGSGVGWATAAIEAQGRQLMEHKPVAVDRSVSQRRDNSSNTGFGEGQYGEAHEAERRASTLRLGKGLATFNDARFAVSANSTRWRLKRYAAP